MSRKLTASDRKALIRLASTMPVGAPERKAILNGLSKAASAKHGLVELTPDSLLQYMRESGDTVTVRALNYAFPDAGGSNAISAMIKRMVKDGKLVKEKKGYSLAKTAKTAARNDKRLAAALLKYLDEIRKDWQKMFDGDKNYARGGKYDPVADVGVAVGPNAKRYTNADADVVLHFDGAGYDIFSEQGDLGIEKYRRDVEKLGQKYGYHAEPLTNWSLGFYYEG